MRRPTKLHLHLLRAVRQESAAHMRARLRKEAFLRAMFWQGEHCGRPVDDVLDIALQKQAVTEQLKQMRQRSTQLA